MSLWPNEDDVWADLSWMQHLAPTEPTSRHVIDEWVEQVTVAGATIREARLQAIIRPRPRWLPEPIWRRLVARLLYLEESP